MSILRYLRKDDFGAFKWHLQQDHTVLEDYTATQKQCLEEANRRVTVDLMVERYSLPGAAKVTKSILKTIHRNDLVQILSDIMSEAEGEPVEKKT